MKAKTHLLITMATAAMLTIACDKKQAPVTNTTPQPDSSLQQTDTLQQEAAAQHLANQRMAQQAARIADSIYNEICREYNAALDDEIANVKPLDERFCSDDWNRNRLMCQHIEETKYPNEVGVIDYDYWCQGQDWGVMRHDKARPIKYENHTAYVTVTLYNGDDPVDITLQMIKENGTWRIDELTTPERMGIKQIWKDFIKEESKTTNNKNNQQQ